ncbi:hypothetical protein GCK72_021477 [Caenorhabditis remanei]|uniref:G-protein coupled receptors family 1 profile domain-containing protein n=1 Tax=Caenorhabditis remanei TaxID=31234 RepID=A0A6A5GK81_CAERE|nr:hypothetical protein GCK72_021477 [Caenorhabditis remanei]KAF1754912.1 hypothetical protein GCK72_021477 [Caenorhabditis remanei]
MLLRSFFTILFFTISLEGCMEEPVTDEPPVTNEPPVTMGRKEMITYQFGPDGCMQTVFWYKRLDERCASISLSATGASCTSTIASVEDASQVSAVLNCQSDGTYSCGSLTGITAITPVLVDCVKKCKTCNFDSIAPLSIPPNRNYAVERMEDGMCNSYFSQCKLDDATQSCATIQILGETASPGNTVLGQTTNSNSAEGCVRMIPPEEVSISSTPAATLPTYEPSSPPPEGSTEATTVQTEAPATNEPPVTLEPPVTMAPPVTEAPVTETPTESCTTCNFAEIKVTPPERDVGDPNKRVTDGCKQVTVTCRRTDDARCADISISATGASGTFSIGNAEEAAEATLICQSDGTYSSVFVDGITELFCTLTNCVRPCATCSDIAEIVTAPPAASAIFETREEVGPDGCKKATVTCRRTNGRNCAEYDENFTLPDYFPDDEEMFRWFYLIERIAQVLEQINNILSIICLVINLAHFLVMIQKKMRTSSINILTIGISFCDIVVIGSTVITIIYYKLSADICWPQFTYLSRVILIIAEFSKDVLLRASPWLGLAMAFIRALFLLFPLSRRIKTLSEKRLAIPIILIVLTLSFFISALFLSRYSIFYYGTWEPLETCGYPPGYTQPMYTIEVGRKIILSYKLATEIYAAVNGAASVIPAVTYTLIAVVLVVQLVKMKKGRSKLFSTRASDASEKDHTTTLVILMTITFFISQLPIGLFMWLRLIYPFHYVIQIALNHATKFTSILFTINATCHCFIFATLSSQYREVVREVFCCRKGKIWPQFTYLSRVVLITAEFSKDSLLRVSPWLGLAMALIRAAVLLFPWRKWIKTLSEKRLAIPIIVVFFSLSSFISALVFSRYSIFRFGTWQPPEICGYPPDYTQPMFTIEVGRKVILSYKITMDIYAAVNGAASIIPAVTYPLIAAVLVVQLLKMKKGRSKLFSTRDTAEKDHTTTLVILMTITFFISQLPVGLFMWLRLIYPFHYVLHMALDHGTKFTSILFTINATFHCFIFATLSSQYREVVREVFCCRKTKNVSGS